MNKLKKTVLITCLLGLSMTSLTCGMSVFGNPLFICYFMYCDAKEEIQKFFASFAKPTVSQKEASKPESTHGTPPSTEEKIEQEN